LTSLNDCSINMKTTSGELKRIFFLMPLVVMSVKKNPQQVLPLYLSL